MMKDTDIGIDLNYPIAIALTAAAKAGKTNLEAQITTELDNPTRYTLNAAYNTSAQAKRGDREVEFGIKPNQERYLEAQFFGENRNEKRFETRLGTGQYAIPTGSAPTDGNGNVSLAVLTHILGQIGVPKSGYYVNKDKSGIYKEGVRLFHLVDQAPDYRQTLDLNEAFVEASETFEKVFMERVEIQWEKSR